MKLEVMIDMTNNLLINKGVADIRKVPSPVKIMDIKGNRVIGCLDTPTWVDYSGVCNGRSIIFDAKETKIERFPLKNIRDHQYELLKSWNRSGAYAFLLVAFWLGANEPEAYILPFRVLEKAWDGMMTGGRKSIPIKQFREECIKVKSANGYPLDY